MDIFEMAIARALAGGGNTGGGGGGASGGCVKSITFTDRPSAFEWLSSNYGRCIKAAVTAFDGSTITTHYFSSIQGNLNPQGIKFTNLMLWEEGTEGDEYSRLIEFCVILTDTEVLYTTSYPQIKFAHNSINLSQSNSTPIPDEYWTQMSVSVTCYYVE